MTRRNFRTPGRHDQKGIALLVGLIFLLVLSVIGLAAVRGTTQQEKMAASTQQQTQTFQGAQAGIRQIMNDALGSQSVGSGQTAEPQFESSSDLSAQATVSYRCVKLVSLNQSLGSNKNAPAEHLFDIDSAANQAGTRATSTQRQGVVVIAAGNSGNPDPDACIEPELNS